MKLFQNKNRFLVSILLALLSILAGCRGGKDENYIEEWLKHAEFSAKQTAEELYQRALLEDTLLIYSESTRVLDTAKSFMKAYPGLTVSVVDIRATDMTQMLYDNYEKGEFACDVVIRNDNDGMLSMELLKKGIVYKYVPYDLAPKLVEIPGEDTLLLVGEIQMLSYNNSVYKEAPVKNWWELTEPQWEGKIAMANPVRSITSFAFLSMVIENHELMRESYEAFYGKPLALESTENAGEYFIKKLRKNGLILTNSSDEVAGMVGAPGVLQPPIGIMISSKLRLSDIGYNLELIYDMEPFCGVLLPNSISVAAGAKNINAAKLFIRFLFGEADGQGEGYQPYLQKGAWSMRTDVFSDTETPLKDINFIASNKEYIYQNSQKINDFWLSLQ